MAQRPRSASGNTPDNRQEDTGAPSGDLNADIEHDPRLVSSHGDVYPKNRPENNNEAVTYSELQRNEDTDMDSQAVAPSSDW